MAKRKINTASLNKTSHNHLSSGPSFDTHKFVKSFTVAKSKESQAEAVINAIAESRDHDISTLATKAQLEGVETRLENKIESVKVELENKIEGVKVQIESLRNLDKIIFTLQNNYATIERWKKFMI